MCNFGTKRVFRRKYKISKAEAPDDYDLSLS